LNDYEELSEMQVEKSKKGMIETFIEQLVSTKTREEAINLTETLLKQYKGKAKNKCLEYKKESKVMNKEMFKENKVLKRGFFILYNRYNVS